MRIQRTSQAITIAIVITSLAAIACALWSRQLRIVQERSYEERRQMFNLTEQLASGSDHLTAAVRAYAATGNERYRAAFERELVVERNRDEASNGLRRLGLTPKELQLINEAKGQSDALVHLEKQALAAADDHDNPRALRLVYGPEYEDAKAQIMNPIAQCREMLEQRLTQNALKVARHAHVLTNVALALLILNASAMVLALVLFYRRHVIAPLAGLNQCLRELAARKAGAKIGFQQENSEIGQVARSMENYRAKVEELLEIVKRTRAREAEAATRELAMAREIQMGMLPHDFAELGREYHVEFGAVLEPAREVGGDLYGVCAADPKRLVVFLGDVSGKGLSASMFMVRAISLARVLSRELSNPEEILARLNDELAMDNPSGMFVTFLCAVFEPQRRRLVIANAGHCRPIVISPNGSARWAVNRLGTALGFDAGIRFDRTELTLHDGDGLLLYSDGVSEAFNPSSECYGNDRLLAEAATFSSSSATEMTSALLRDVRKFANSAPQSDDIAILALKVNSAWGRPANGDVAQ